MVLKTANAKQRVEFLDAKHIALDAQLVASAPDLKQHVGRPACLLTSSRKARLAVLLGTETVATIEVDTVEAEAWVTRSPTLGNRSAGSLDLNEFLQQNARGQKTALGTPAFSSVAAEEPSPAADTAPPSSNEEPFSLSNTERRKLSRVRAAREQSEAAAQLLKQKEEGEAEAVKTQAAVTIQRVFGVALRARAPSPPYRAATGRSETFRRQLDALELELLFEPLAGVGVWNMEQLNTRSVADVLAACGLFASSSTFRPRLTRSQEASLSGITLKNAPAPPTAKPASAPPVTPTAGRVAKLAPAPAPLPLARPSTPAAAPLPARPAAPAVNLLSTIESYAASPAEFTKFLKIATGMADPPNLSEVKRSKPKMVEVVEEFIRGFITSARDIPWRNAGSLNAISLAGLLVDIIEINGGHASDEDGAAPFAVADTAEKRDGFAAFIAENGLEDKLDTLLKGGITTVQALRRYTPAEVEEKCETDFGAWKTWELRALQTLTLKEVPSALAVAPKLAGRGSAARPGGDVRPSTGSAPAERFKQLPLVEVAMKNVPTADCPGCTVTWLNSLGKAAARALGDTYDLPELGSEADNAENLEVLLECLVKAAILEVSDLKAEADESDGLQSARLRARRLAIEMAPAARPTPSAPVDPLIDVKQQAITRELLAAAGKTAETSAEKAAGEKRLLDVARDAALSARVLHLHALETAGNLKLDDFKKAASAVQVAELLKQSKIGLPTGASPALRTLWEAYSAVQRGFNREVVRALEKLMPEGADCEALANATLEGSLHTLDLQKVVSSKATKTVFGTTSPKTKAAAAKADAADAASESYAHCITGLEFALEVFNPNDQSVIATMRLVRSEVESLHRSGFNRGDAANKLLSALLTEYDHDHEEFRRGRATPLLSTAWETALKTNKISKLISSSGGENVKVSALETLVKELTANLKTAADEAHKAATKGDKMATRLTELEQLCAKRWKETKSNFLSDESGSESSRPATPNGGRGKGGKLSFAHPSKGAGAPAAATASAPAAQ